MQTLPVVLTSLQWFLGTSIGVPSDKLPLFVNVCRSDRNLARQLLEDGSDVPGIMHDGKEGEVAALARLQAHRRCSYVGRCGGNAVAAGDTYTEGAEPVRSRNRSSVRVRGGFAAADTTSQGTVAVRLVQWYFLPVIEILPDLTVGGTIVPGGRAGSIAA